MPVWLSKVMSALGGHSATRDAVHATMHEAQGLRTKLSLDVITTASARGNVLTTVLEQIDGETLIISQPSVGGLTHPLAFGETMKLSFVQNNQHHVGQCRCLGRVKIAAGNGQPEHLLFAYRLSIPESLQVEDRRREPRVDIAFGRTIEAQLYSPRLEGPLLGTVQDISMTGARIRSAMGVGSVASGQELFLKSMMPEPIGLVDEVVEVVRVEVDPNTGHHTIGIAFRRKVQGLEDFIRQHQPTVTVMRRTA